MKLRHLEYFVAVAEELNMRIAAERLHISQPPLSRQICDLEKDLDAKLFDRTGKKLRLTEAGEFFLNEAREILFKAQRASQLVKSVNHAETGPLIIAYRVPMEGMLPTHIIRKIRESFPSVKFIIKEMTIQDQIIALLENRIDLGFVGFRNLELQDILNYETILRSEVMVVLSSEHKFSKRKRLNMAELSDEPFIFVERETSPFAYDWLVNIPKICGFTPNVVQQADTSRNLFRLVAAGYGISLVPDVLKCYATLDVSLRPLKNKIVIDWSIAWRKGNNSPVLELFLRLLKENRKFALL